MTTQLAERWEHLGEVPGHRPCATAHQLDFVPVAEDERAEAVPFRLVFPAVALGDAVARRRQHRFHIQRYRKLQGRHLSPVCLYLVDEGTLCYHIAGR